MDDIHNTTQHYIYEPVPNLVWYLIIDFGIQWVAWVGAAALKTEKFYDLTGSITYILLAILSQQFGNGSTRSIVQSCMVVAWACRLGIFLFYRVLKDGKDKRFDDIKTKPLVFCIPWNLQAFWVYVNLLPTFLMSESSLNPSLGALDFIGWGMWLFGIVFEVVSDVHKIIWRKNAQNAGKFIDAGLWSVSRHPNYFGEIFLWFGLFVSATSVLRRFEFFAVLCPIAIHLLITRISGIPKLEESGAKKWGTLPEYQLHLEKTAMLIPFVRCYWVNYIFVWEFPRNAAVTESAQLKV